MNMFDFKDRVAVVTGGARGIGRCIRNEFEKAGAKVAVIDLIEHRTVNGDIQCSGADYGVVISASHNSGEYNGIKIFSKDGYYVSDAELVEVIINGQYWGVYLLAEQQQINKDRVDITEAAEGYTGTDIGYFLEFDGYFWTEDPLQQFTIDYAKRRGVPCQLYII